MSVTEDRDCVVRRNIVGWFDSIEHNRWLSGHMQALIEEAEGAIVATGFAHLDADGKPDPTRSIDLAVTGRMAYVFSLGALMGLPGTRRYADHAVKALTNYFTDPVNGGMWFAIKPEPDADGRGVPWDEDARVKSQYHTVYALLGVAAATVANRPGAHELLNRMLEEQKELWVDDYGLVWDQYDEAFNEPVPVHTLGTLIHTIEAYMAAAEATTEPEWLDRAEKMTAFAYKIASKNGWRIPEFFDEKWEPSPEAGKLLNDGRRYYEGYVTGHSMQLGRFALQVRSWALNFSSAPASTAGVAPTATPASPPASTTRATPCPARTSTSSGSSARVCAPPLPCAAPCWTTARGSPTSSTSSTATAPSSTTSTTTSSASPGDGCAASVPATRTCSPPSRRAGMSTTPSRRRSRSACRCGRRRPPLSRAASSIAPRNRPPIRSPGTSSGCAADASDV